MIFDNELGRVAVGDLDAVGFDGIHILANGDAAAGKAKEKDKILFHSKDLQMSKGKAGALVII